MPQQQQIYQPPVSDPQANYWGNPTNLGQQYVPDVSAQLPSADHPIQRGLHGFLQGAAAGSSVNPYGGSIPGAILGGVLGMFGGEAQNAAANKQRNVQQKYATSLQQTNNNMYHNNLSNIQQQMTDRIGNEPEAIRQAMGYQDQQTGQWYPRYTIQNATSIQDAQKQAEGWHKQIDDLEKRGQGPQVTGFMSGAGQGQQTLPNSTRGPASGGTPGIPQQSQPQGQKAQWAADGSPILQAGAQETSQPPAAQNNYWNQTPMVSQPQLQESYGVPPNVYTEGLKAVTEANKMPYQNYSELASGNRNQAEVPLIQQRTSTEKARTQLTQEEANTFNKYRAAQITELEERAKEHARSGGSTAALKEQQYLTQLKTIEHWRQNGQINDTEAQKLTSFPDSIRDITLQSPGYWHGKAATPTLARNDKPKPGSMKTVVVGKTKGGESVVVQRQGRR